MPRLTAHQLLDAHPDAAVVLVSLMRRYAGHRIPRITATTERNVSIRAAVDSGESYRSVARRFRLQVSTVYAIAVRS